MSSAQELKKALAVIALDGAEIRLKRECNRQGWLIDRITDEPLVRQWRIRMPDGMPRYYTLKFAEPI